MHGDGTGRTRETKERNSGSTPGRLLGPLRAAGVRFATRTPAGRFQSAEVVTQADAELVGRQAGDRGVGGNDGCGTKDGRRALDGAGDHVA